MGDEKETGVRAHARERTSVFLYVWVWCVCMRARTSVRGRGMETCVQRANSEFLDVLSLEI